VISPEGCASILWRSASRAADAAEAMKITAGELLNLRVIDRIVYEPAGGAHRDHETTIKRVGVAIGAELAALRALSPAALRAERRTKYLQIGRMRD